MRLRLRAAPPDVLEKIGVQSTSEGHGQRAKGNLDRPVCSNL
ncbi:MAG TPA: hypothetical protein VG675_07755 [Bryobacteraceae bacterium]|nr:hypothetical protein [Bryobacteraceae bacterium]